MVRQRGSFVVGASAPCFFLKPLPKVDTSLRNSIGGDFYLSVGLMEFQWFRRQNDMHFSCWKRESSVGLMEFQWFCRQNDMHFSCWKRESSVWPTVCFCWGHFLKRLPNGTEWFGGHFSKIMVRPLHRVFSWSLLQKSTPPFGIPLGEISI